MSLGEDEALFEKLITGYHLLSFLGGSLNRAAALPVPAGFLAWFGCG
jgi:hypothetical protein